MPCSLACRRRSFPCRGSHPAGHCAQSNSAHNAILKAAADIRAGKAGPVPRQLQNRHFDGEDAAVKGQNYLYPHDYANHWVAQQYLPDELRGTVYYEYGDNKTEQAAKAYWQKVKG